MGWRIHVHGMVNEVKAEVEAEVRLARCMRAACGGACELVAELVACELVACELGKLGACVGACVGACKLHEAACGYAYGVASAAVARMASQHAWPRLLIVGAALDAWLVDGEERRR